MPYKVTTEDGDEIETYTQEELDSMAAERAKEEAERVEAEKQEEIERLAKEKEELEEKYNKLKDKDLNFEKVRKKAEGKEVEVSEEVRNQISALEEKINQLASQPKNEVKEDFIRQYVGSDKEKQERFDYYYAKLGADAKNKEEVLKAAQEALSLASGGEYKPDTSFSMYGAGVNQNYRDDKPKELSEESKHIGGMFGITDEDRKKYGKK